MNINEFKSNLGVSDLPSELENLIKFDSNLSDNQYYSDGFFTDPFGRAGLATWSSKEEFLNNL